MRQPGNGPARLEPVAKPKKIEFEVELITPLFGGGAVPREVDKISWLRSASVKSAIRAWWRIGSAHRFNSPQQMREHEDVLFGAQAQYDEKGKPLGGQGILSVFVQPRPIATRIYDESAENPLNGAYFPALPMKRPAALLGIPGSGTRLKVSLTLSSRPGRLVTEFHEREIKLALRLWLTLGGAGARTRRGAGGLAVPYASAANLGVPTSVDELETFLSEHCETSGDASIMEGVFCMRRTRSVLVGREFGTHEEAHKELLKAMRDARQDRKHPADWKRGDWGRSRWPEADAIRLKASRTRDGSEWSHVPEQGNAKQYPRAALGLPIVVYFMKKPEKPHEPQGHNIYGVRTEKNAREKIERYASPVLLRVVRVWRDSVEKFVPVALFTECTLPKDTVPLVTKKEAGSVDARDVVEEFNIRKRASYTLERVEKKFVAAGFKRVGEKP